MERVLISTLVVITLLQLCRAQSSNSTPEWYAANDINDTNFSPKPITELFSTETSFSPEEPIIVLSPTIPANRGIVSSPTPIIQYSESTDSQPPSNVIPLSSTELPTSSRLPETIASVTQTPQIPSATPQQIPTTESTITPNRANQVPGQLPRNNVLQNPQQNQPSFPSNRLPAPLMQPRNIQFLLPPQMGNRIFQGQQLPPNGQPNVFVLYEQAPQNILNMPSNSPILQPPRNFPSQPLMPIRDSQQPNVARVPNTIIQPQMSNQFFPQPNVLPPSNIPPISSNPFPSSPSNNLQGGQTPINPPPNNNQQINNQTSINLATVNQNTDIQQPLIQYQQPINQMPIPLNIQNNGRRRPLQQRNRVAVGNNKRRRLNIVQPQNQFPCQGLNRTAVRSSTATNTQNPVITIRLRSSQNPILSGQINRSPTTTTGPSTMRPRQNSQTNTRNYERCLNSCRDKKDRICAVPETNVEIDPNTLKGFPSMCHMACHNTFRANPIYERIANGRCGKLRTRIQSVEKTKVRRDELKKSQYTIISNVPGTIVELAP